MSSPAEHSVSHLPCQSRWVRTRLTLRLSRPSHCRKCVALAGAPFRRRDFPSDTRDQSLPRDCTPTNTSPVMVGRITQAKKTAAAAHK